MRGRAATAPRPGVGPNANGCGVGLTLPAPPTFGDAADAVKDLSSATQDYIRACGCATQACIADALDQYSQALAQVAPRLPPRLRNAPDIVATAARRVRVARTKTEALRALHDAIAAIHKDIEFVRAEDPDNYQRRRAAPISSSIRSMSRASRSRMAAVSDLGVGRRPAARAALTRGALGAASEPRDKAMEAQCATFRVTGRSAGEGFGSPPSPRRRRDSRSP